MTTSHVRGLLSEIARVIDLNSEPLVLRALQPQPARRRRSR